VTDAAYCSRRRRWGTMVYFGSRAEAIPAWKIPNLVMADAASSDPPARADTARLRPPSTAPASARAARAPRPPAAGGDPGAPPPPDPPPRQRARRQELGQPEDRARRPGL